MVAKRKLNYTPRMASSNKRGRVATTKPAIAKVVRSTIARMAEKKVFGVSLIEAALSSATISNAWQELSNVPQGVGHGNRVGREIKLDSVYIRNTLKNNATGTHHTRIIVGYMKDQTLPATTSELFDSPGSSAPTTGTAIGGGNGMLGLVSPINKAKFTVLYDKVHRTGAAGSVDGADSKYFTISLNLRGAKTNFEATTAGVANQDRQLYIGAFTVEAGNDTAGGTTVEWSLYSELKYTDL